MIMNNLQTCKSTEEMDSTRRTKRYVADSICLDSKVFNDDSAIKKEQWKRKKKLDNKEHVLKEGREQGKRRNY